MKKWKVLDSEIAFDNPHMLVRQDKVELPDGKVFDDYYVWVCGDVAMTIPVTPEGELIMVKQYKHGAGDVMVEFPAGLVDEGEKPEVAAKRELVEETGYTTDGLEFVVELHNSPTKRVGSVLVYLATNVVKTEKTKFDAHEDIETLELTPEELWKMVSSGEIYASDSVAASMLYLRQNTKVLNK